LELLNVNGSKFEAKNNYKYEKIKKAETLEIDYFQNLGFYRP
jgi:hypothetical protein